MDKLRLLLLSTILTLSACASTTPIAVSTPQWQVPAPDPVVSQQEAQAQVQMNLALQAWNKWLLASPTAAVK